MIVLLSPSKTLNTEPQKQTTKNSTPELLNYTQELIQEFKKYSSEDLQKIMKISPKLAELNVQRFNDFHTPFTPKNAKQAILTFIGDVYRDIDVQNYTKEDFDFAQKHIRTLSGLYGILKPLDLIQPYRLEMHLKAKYWQDKVTPLLAKEKLIINLASQEYFAAVDPKKIKGEIITPTFKEKKNGKYQIIALYSKIARGTMANFIIKNRINKPNDLRYFTEDGYKFDPKLGDDKTPTFTRSK